MASFSVNHNKYRVLIVGDNKTVLDMFFYHMDSFEIQTSSTRYDDIISHFKYFKPQVFVYCVVDAAFNGIKKVQQAKAMMAKDDVQFVFIGTPDESKIIEKMIPGTVDVFIERPFTTASVQEKITELITIYEEKKEEEARIAAEEKAKLEEQKRKLEEEKAALEAEEGNGDILDGEMDVDIDQLLEEVKKADRRKHVLVVDDDSGMLKVIKEHIKSDYDVATAISGKLARKFLEKKDTDLILLDYMMPGEDGPAVLKTLRENPKTKNIPVVFLTGMTEREKIMELLSGPIRPQGYILKPVEKDKLLATVKNTIG